MYSKDKLFKQILACIHEILGVLVLFGVSVLIVDFGWMEKKDGTGTF